MHGSAMAEQAGSIKIERSLLLLLGRAGVDGCSKPVAWRKSWHCASRRGRRYPRKQSTDSASHFTPRRNSRHGK
jgi:hypothetical protein